MKLSDIDTTQPATDVYDEAFDYFFNECHSIEEAAERADNWTLNHLTSGAWTAGQDV